MQHPQPFHEFRNVELKSGAMRIIKPNEANRNIRGSSRIEWNTRERGGCNHNRKGSHYYAHRIVSPDGTTVNSSQEIKKENAAQELPRGVTVSGSLADTTSAASTNSIRQEGQRSQEVFQKIARRLKTASLRISIGHAKKQPLGCFLVTRLR